MKNTNLILTVTLAVLLTLSSGCLIAQTEEDDNQEPTANEILNKSSEAFEDTESLRFRLNMDISPEIHNTTVDLGDTLFDYAFLLRDMPSDHVSIEAKVNEQRKEAKLSINVSKAGIQIPFSEFYVKADTGYIHIEVLDLWFKVTDIDAGARTETTSRRVKNQVTP
ncbi:MAG: hypothetical protein ABEK59_10780 [Halobacteria archaeon]